MVLQKKYVSQNSRNRERGKKKEAALMQPLVNLDAVSIFS